MVRIGGEEGVDNGIYANKNTIIFICIGMLMFFNHRLEDVTTFTTADTTL